MKSGKLSPANITAYQTELLCISAGVLYDPQQIHMIMSPANVRIERGGRVAHHHCYNLEPNSIIRKPDTLSVCCIVIRLVIFNGTHYAVCEDLQSIRHENTQRFARHIRSNNSFSIIPVKASSRPLIFYQTRDSSYFVLNRHAV